MKIGFTGTRKGMTQEQKEKVVGLVEELSPDEIHEGRCIGADNDFVNICLFLTKIPSIVSHPGYNLQFGNEPHLHHNNTYDFIREPQSYFKRNRTIVDETDLLIATPVSNNNNQTTGGTWYTIKYAIKKHKPVVIIYPNGTTEKHNV